MPSTGWLSCRSKAQNSRCEELCVADGRGSNEECLSKSPAQLKGWLIHGGLDARCCHAGSAYDEQNERQQMLRYMESFNRRFCLRVC